MDRFFKSAVKIEWRKTEQYPGNYPLDIRQDETLIGPQQQQMTLESSREKQSINKNIANEVY